MGKEKYNKEELIRLLIHEGKSYKEVAAMRGDGSTGEAIRKAANRYGIKVSDRKKLRKCEYCGKEEHDGFLLVLEDFVVQIVQRNIHLVSAKVKNQKINLLKKKK